MSKKNYYREAAVRLVTLLTESRKTPINKNAKDLSSGEKGILSILSWKKEPLTAGELGRITGIGSGGIANVLNSLEKKGFIKRDINPGDRRSVIVTITDSGTELISEKQKEMMSQTEDLLKALGRDDTEDLLRLLQRVLEISPEICAKYENKKQDSDKERNPEIHA